MNLRQASLLAAFILAVAAVPAAEAKEHKLTTSHYTIRTDVSLAFAKELARTMEAIYSGYRDRLKTLGRNRKGRHTVIVFNQRAAYLGFVGPRYASSGGIYMPSMNALATYLSGQSYERMTETLKHEGPVVLHVAVEPEENVYPMVAAGKSLQEMDLGKLA